jgi:hypothetical protein
MPARDKNKIIDLLLSTITGDRLKTVEREYRASPILPIQREWNYNEFVTYALEYVSVLRRRDEMNNKGKEKK